MAEFEEYAKQQIDKILANFKHLFNKLDMQPKPQKAPFKDTTEM